MNKEITKTISQYFTEIIFSSGALVNRLLTTNYIRYTNESKIYP